MTPLLLAVAIVLYALVALMVLLETGDPAWAFLWPILGPVWLLFALCRIVGGWCEL